LGFESNYIAFAGGASIASPQIIDGVASNQNLAGVSYGFGVLATIKREFQVGLVVGQDRVDDSANFSRDGNTWVALSFGYEFSN